MNGQMDEAGGGDDARARQGAKNLPNSDFEILAAMSPELKQKFKELMDKGHNINALLLQFFAERKEKIEQEKEIIAEDQRQEQEDKSIIGMPASRYISVKIKKIIHEEHGDKCSIPGCSKLAKVLHHATRFAIARMHDPRFLAPLCEGHHEIAHRVDRRVSAWRAGGKVRGERSVSA